ncbi:hypothetical protein APR12_003287 [Nocardia amikacinitolerans]|uniref:hypothetical protein n=1 Tax=Nocardia amikacinitolerans TaxID=756689 RepID=UPI000829E5E1|nr:hypothetical protein [Nocardia amikacinitolerans]MCP2317934.1 hypothetical protein [Nocardia amikacinitolerans]
MSLNPGQPAATDPGLFSIPMGPERRKVVQKYRALAEAIGRTWEATVRSNVALHPGSRFEIDCEQVVIDAASALVIARTIDQQFESLLAPNDQDAYKKFRDDDTDGRIVRGLTLIRNADTHADSVIEMDSNRVVGGRGGWRVFPVWKEHADLPAEIQNLSGTARGVHRRYRDWVGGRLVVETLLDVMRFFDRCDPSLTRRSESGDLQGFPLVDLGARGYDCLHPYWLRENELSEQLLDRFMSRAPTGLGRRIHRAVPHADTTLFMGVTELGRHGMSFIESAEQVARDIAGGYVYTATTKDGDIVVTHRDGVLMLEANALAEVELTASGDKEALAQDGTDDHIRASWEAQMSDAFWYREHRRPVA